MQIIRGGPATDRRTDATAMLMNDHAPQSARPGGNPQVVVHSDTELAGLDACGVVDLVNGAAGRRPLARCGGSLFLDQWSCLLEQLGRFLFRLVNWQPLADTRPLVANRGEVRVVQHAGLLLNESQEFRVGFGDRGNAPGQQHRVSEDAVAKRVGVNPVGRERVLGVRFSLFGQVLCDWRVQIDDHLDPVFLFKDPPGEPGNDIAIVVLINCEVGKLLGTSGPQCALLLLERYRVKRWGCHQDELGAAGVDLLDQPVDTVLIDLKSLLREVVVDAIVHPVTGDNHLGLDSFQRAVQSFVDVGSWEGMGRFGLSRTGLAGEADVVEGWKGRNSLETALGFDPRDVATSVGDRVTQEEDLLGLQGEGDGEIISSRGCGGTIRRQEAGGEKQKR